MPITQSHLAWFKPKCPNPTNSQSYKQAYAKLNNATYADLEKLRAEFDEYEDNSIPVRHYNHLGKWYAKPISGGTAQELDMKGIQRHGKKWRAQKRCNRQLRKWTYGTLKEAQRKRDMAFG